MYYKTNSAVFLICAHNVLKREQNYQELMPALPYAVKGPSVQTVGRQAWFVHAKSTVSLSQLIFFALLCAITNKTIIFMHF